MLEGSRSRDSDLGSPQLAAARTGPLMIYDKHLPERQVISVSEGPPPTVTPDTATGPDAGLSHGDVRLATGPRLAGTIAGRLTDQARRTASAARARRMATGDGEPGVLDLTPLRELLSELVAELAKLRPRDRIARALRQAADVIDSQTPLPANVNDPEPPDRPVQAAGA
jgi:hypothetical protein